MYTEIQTITDKLFEPLPCSAAAETAKAKISQALCSEYEKRLQDCTQIEALGSIMCEYGNLQNAAALAGYNDKDVERWYDDGGCIDLCDAKKYLKRSRHAVYLCSLFLTAAIAYPIGAVVMRSLFYLLLCAICAALSAVFFFRYKRLGKQFLFDDISYGKDVRKYLTEQYDRYSKRLINSVGLAFVMFSLLAYMLFGMNMKFMEALSSLFGSIIVLDICMFIVAKNYLCRRLFRGALGNTVPTGYKKSLAIFVYISAGYWVLVVLLSLIFIGQVLLLGSAAVVYFTALLVYDLTLRKRIVFRNIIINKRRIAVFTAAAVTVAAYNALQADSYIIQPYISGVAAVEHKDSNIEYNEDTGVYTITSGGGDFKILHLTDIHLGGSSFSADKDIKALKTVYDLIEYSKPDLIIITGDLTFPMGIMSLSLNNYTPVRQFCEFMRNIGIPWAFTYGNHDTENMATGTAAEIDELFKEQSFKTSGNLLYPYTQPGCFGRNNQIIEIRNADKSLSQALFLIDSNAYTGDGINDYDYIHDDQVDWYARNVKRLNEQEGRTVSSMLFFHIPLQEYKTAYELYESGSDEVTYYFGENGEKMIDKVCCSDHPSKLFETAKELGSTKAMFCGHDHYNNLSVEYRGIRLTYGLSIDYLAMPGIDKDTAQRGAEVITLHENSDYDIEQIHYSDIKRGTP